MVLAIRSGMVETLCPERAVGQLYSRVAGAGSILVRR